MADQKSRIEAIRAAMPSGGLFADKDWLISPEPFPISRKLFRSLDTLGHKLYLFQRAANQIYLRSAKGRLPEWIADYLDRGKPEELIARGRNGDTRDEVPRVIRPDVILTEGDGIAITELDNLPGGIGLTAWLNETYAGLGDEVIGGPTGMLEGFDAMLPNGADIVISEESSDYRPEMEWLAEKVKGDWNVASAESYTPGNRDIYRFFELFDLANIPSAKAIADSDATVTAPYKAFLEEKMWAALFSMPSLREVWRGELRDSHIAALRECFPFSWIIDPTPLPHHGVFPRLEINDWNALKDFSQKERRLVLKISGFSELAWGSRGVHIGEDMPQTEWAEAVDRAITDFEHHPWLLQEFRKGRTIEHPFWNEESGEVETRVGRVRLCPYYFIPGEGKPAPKLCGILATIVPADKKVIHGMRDSILVPCCISGDE